MKEYKVVRCYDYNGINTKALNEYFQKGWQFERASEYVAGTSYKEGYTVIKAYGYIEYIISRPIKTV